MLVSKAYLLVCKDFEIFHPHFLSGEAEMGGLCLRLSFFFPYTQAEQLKYLDPMEP